MRTDHAGLFAGELSGNVKIEKLRSKRDYSAKIELKDVDFAKIAEVYFPGQESDGRFDALFSWHGRDLEMNSLNGTGTARLRDSAHIEVPLLGPLSSLMKDVIGKTKISHGSIHDLDTKFSIKDSTVSLEKMTADLDAFRIEGKGNIHLPSEAVEFQASLINQSVPTAVLGVLYEIFGSYKCTGTLDNPEWKSTNRFTASEVLNAGESLVDPNKEVRPGPDKPAKLDAKEILDGLLSNGEKPE